MAAMIHWKLIQVLAKLHALPSLLYSDYIPWDNFPLQGLKTTIYKQWATSPFSLIGQDKKEAQGFILCSARVYPEGHLVCAPLALYLASLLSLWPCLNSGPNNVLLELSSHHKSLLLSPLRVFLRQHRKTSQQPFLIQPELLITIIKRILLWTVGSDLVYEGLLLVSLNSIVTFLKIFQKTTQDLCLPA